MASAAQEAAPRRTPAYAGVAAPSLPAGAGLSVVPAPRPRPAAAAPRAPFLIFVSAIALAGVIGLLMFNTSMQQAAFAQSNLEAQAASLAAQEQALTSQIDAMSSGPGLAKAAARLGMVQSMCPAFISLTTGKVSGQPCVATAGTSVPAEMYKPAPIKPLYLEPTPVIKHVAPPASTATTTTTTGARGRDAASHTGRSGRGSHVRGR